MSKMITNEQQFNDAIARSGDKIVVALFESKDCQLCGPANSYASQLEAQDPGKVQVIRVDAGLPGNQALLTKLDIQSTPTFVVYRQGKQVYKMVGLNADALFNLVPTMELWKPRKRYA